MRKFYRKPGLSGQALPESNDWDLPGNYVYLRDERRPSEEDERKDRCFVAPEE